MDFGRILFGFWTDCDGFWMNFDGFGRILAGVWLRTVSRMHVCILSRPLYIPGSSASHLAPYEDSRLHLIFPGIYFQQIYQAFAFYLPLVSRMHMCILCP